MLWPTSGKYMIPWLLSSAAGLFFMAVSSMAQFFSHQKKKLISQGKE
jgi:hypothetical protein